MQGESKHTVQVGALDQFCETQEPLGIRTMSGMFYEDCCLVQYDQYALAVVWRGRLVLLYKHGIEAIESLKA